MLLPHICARRLIVYYGILTRWSSIWFRKNSFKSSIPITGSQLFSEQSMPLKLIAPAYA